VRDIERLPSRNQAQVLARISEMSDDLKEDVTRLTIYTPEYRLRVGDYRVLFEVEEETIVIYRIRHRSKAYR
jgi:mRNA interferase RelE/StbE